jgi:hypothetical protein
MAAPTSLPTGDRTTISNQTDISFCNSPIHIRLNNAANDANILSAYVYLWVWSGNQNRTLGNPTQVLYAEKVSATDKYINFEISEYIKAFLVSPTDAPNTNQPNFAYNELVRPTVTGQGVFWQIVTDITSVSGTVRNNYRTSFATLGYRYDFENSATVPYSAILPNYPRWFNPKIHNYFRQSFDFTKSVATATSSNLIAFEDVAPTGYLREALDPFLIVYLNKLGLWDCFTPDGKAVFDQKKTMATNNLSYRDPNRIDNSYVHSKLTDNFDIEQTITINTGSLYEDMVERVQQIVLSPKVYLIKFKGDVQTTTTVGITIDNALVTIDSLTIRIDSQTVTAESLGLYKTHRQIPVILKDTDFQIKNRVNDKNKIDYNLKFEVTTNLINDIR